MKTIIHSIQKSGLYLTITFLLVLTISACTTKAKFLPSVVVPAAEGTVQVTKDKNNNNKIRIDFVNLAESTKLHPPKETYVVWMVTDDQVTRNIGKIQSSEKLISSSLKASFETVTPLNPVKIFITAEDDGDIQFPGSQVVLTTENLKRMQ